MKPFEGLLALSLSQFLGGPSAALRLADLGARVIKIKRPGTGDPCRMVQRVSRANGASLDTTLCPIREDGQFLSSPLGAPKVGEHNFAVSKEYLECL